MKTYHFRLIADFRVDAENVVDATRAARMVKTVRGDAIGARRLPKNRDVTRWRVWPVSTRLERTSGES